MDNNNRISRIRGILNEDIVSIPPSKETLVRLFETIYKKAYWDFRRKRTSYNEAYLKGLYDGMSTALGTNKARNIHSKTKSDISKDKIL